MCSQTITEVHFLMVEFKKKSIKRVTRTLVSSSLPSTVLVFCSNIFKKTIVILYYLILKGFEIDGYVSVTLDIFFVLCLNLLSANLFCLIFRKLNFFPHNMFSNYLHIFYCSWGSEAKLCTLCSFSETSLFGHQIHNFGNSLFASLFHINIMFIYLQYYCLPRAICQLRILFLF